MTDAPDDTPENLLHRAAELAVERGVPSEHFMAAAWQAYIAHHPTMAAELEALHLMAHLHVLRQQGRLAAA